MKGMKGMRGMKGMKGTVYVIQPFRYRHPLAKILKQSLKKKYPGTKFKIKQNYTQQKTTFNNTYFIINNPQLKCWDGLQISKKIRENEPKAILILASTVMDYTTFFRSHIGFLGVIDLQNTTDAEIQSYLEDSIKMLSNNT
ncbi:Uncharacterised protein [Streptococcus acidominimus]|uniref:Uncharacterized protein n=1 Tax=Streptococcus acidominimus TaxID=1326 RepID=A0A239XNB6_STRAI|nr:hypothetical protein [Streptococcus acidominimus]SNV47686.1 Uncharacterised protein [Streptococcus acidominimus]